MLNGVQKLVNPLQFSVFMYTFSDLTSSDFLKESQIKQNIEVTHTEIVYFLQLV